MEKLTVDEYLVFKKPEEEGPDIRGGSIDALIIQATKATKNGGELRVLSILVRRGGSFDKASKAAPHRYFYIAVKITLD